MGEFDKLGNFVRFSNQDGSANFSASRGVDSYVYNLKESNMSKWIDAKKQARDGGAPVISLFGDSTFAGAGAGTGGATALIGAKARNVGTKLADALRKMGVPARAGHFCGSNNVTSAAGITYDSTAATSYCPQLSYTGTTIWGQQTLGVLMLRLSAAADKVSWTPTHSFNKIVITYVQNAGLANVSVDVDGGASIGTIVGNGATALKTAVFDCTEGVHTVNITSTTAGSFYVRSIRCYSTSRGAVDIMTAAHWGGLVNDFNGTSVAWSPGNVIGIDGQALTIVKIMTNDANGATTVASYKASMETLIGRIKDAGSDVVLCSGNPFASASYYNGKAATFVATLRDQLAVSFDCPFIDLDGYFGPQNEQRVGYYYDSLHPAEALYAEEAHLIAQALTAV